MLNSDPQNARIELDAAMRRLVTSMYRSQTELFKEFMGDPEFREQLITDMFGLTYPQAA